MVFSPKGQDPLRVALRTYSLSLSLSLLPAILPILTSSKARSPSRIRDILRRELGPTGFAFAMTLAIGGGRALDHLWNGLDHHFIQLDSSGSYPNRHLRRLSPSQRTFLVNTLSASVAAVLLNLTQRSRHIPTAAIPLTVPSPPWRGSPTLDLTLLLFVRALDAGAQSLFHRSHTTQRTDYCSELSSRGRIQFINRMSAHLDAFVFWIACSRIMWCFFYEPERLPRSYVKWITSLADLDSRIPMALRAIRDGRWQYSQPSLAHGNLLTSLASDLNLDSRWGDPRYLPAHGGTEADRAWKALGVQGRRGVGGLPCDIVHGGTAGNSCTTNALMRGIRAFKQALLIYTPVHLLPAFLSNPTKPFTDPLPILLSLIRSASFLSTFVSSIWITVCFVRTLVIPRLFPRISHNILDGPYGAMLAGSLVCGASIGIERGKRRGEIALYVLPRAIRTCLPSVWVKGSSWSARSVERLVFVTSLAYILTSAIHQPNTLRGLSRWTVEYVMSGTGSRFWKRRRQSHVSPTKNEKLPSDYTRKQT